MEYNYKEFKENLDETKGLVEKVVYIDGVKVSMMTYLIQFDGLFDNEIRTEMRGITFVDEKTPFIALHKFFNLNQRAHTMYDVLKDKKIVEVTEKVDGSMINPVFVNDKIYMKSMFSINESVQSKKATEIVLNNSEYEKWIRDMNSLNLYPIFEYTSNSPEEQIILKYEKTELILLQIRDSRGNYLDVESFDSPFKLRKNYGFKTLKEISDYMGDVEDIEGFVVRFEDGMMIKMKSEWYFERHAFYEDNFTNKAIFTSILDNTIDDILSKNSSTIKEYDKIRINAYIGYVSNYINDVMHYVMDIDYNHNRKELAINNRQDEYFDLIMLYKSGGVEESYKKLIKNMKTKYNGLQKINSFLEELEVKYG